MSRYDDVAVGVISADIGLTLEGKLPVERLQKPIGLPLPELCPFFICRSSALQSDPQPIPMRYPAVRPNTSIGQNTGP